MAFIKFNHQEIRAIIASLEEIESNERNEFEDSVLRKSREILKLQAASRQEIVPELITNDDGSLTIVHGNEISEKVSYKGVARLRNMFAVSDYWSGTFPTNRILRIYEVMGDNTTDGHRTLGSSGHA